MEKVKLSISNTKENKLPSNIEAEQSLIGSVLVNNDIIDEISNIVSAGKFFDPIHRKIYEVIESLNNKGMIANPITLKNFFENDAGLSEVGGVDYLVKLTRFSSSVKQAIDYAKIIHEMYVKRELIFISDGISDQAKDDQTEMTGENMIEDAEKSLFDLAERGNFSQTFLKFNQAIDQTIEMATLAMKSDQGIVGVPTGLTDLDEKLGGLHRSDLVIIAGRPSMGKTALATNIAYYAAKSMQENNEKGSVAFFSLEMSSEQLSTRILSEQARISSHEIRTGKATEETLNRYIETSRNIYDLPLYIDETPAIAISTLSNRARRIKRLFGLKLIVVDYIQLMRTNSKRMDGRVQEISEITQGLKAIAIISIIFYHLPINVDDFRFFSGGFFGIDIFFTISGYLITSIILRELVLTGSFSFKNFYEKRIRRIIPVLLFVILASIPLAWLLLLPNDIAFAYCLFGSPPGGIGNIDQY